MTLIQDQTKDHDVIDDIESVLWAIVFVAIRRFEFTGNFPMGMFDEQYELIWNQRKEYTGGNLKFFWLANPPIGIFGRFECHALEAFFTKLRGFHNIRLQKWRAVRELKTTEARDALERCRDDIKKDLRQVLTFFNDILDDETLDWSGGRPITSGEKKTVEKEVVEETPEPIAKAQGNKKRQTQDDANEDNPRPAKRVAVARDVDTKDAQPPKRPRRRRNVPQLPRKVYNLRPRKK